MRLRRVGDRPALLAAQRPPRAHLEGVLPRQLEQLGREQRARQGRAVAHVCVELHRPLCGAQQQSQRNSSSSVSSAPTAALYYADAAVCRRIRCRAGGFSAWEHNSEVIHSTAEDPEGPYIGSDVASPPWTHNPTVTLVNGTYVLYHLGAGRPNGGPKTNCSAGVTHGRGTTSVAGPAAAARASPAAAPPSPPSPLMPAVSWSSSPAGPWSSQGGTREGWGLNNPAAHFLPNGSVFMLCARPRAACHTTQGVVSSCLRLPGDLV